MYIKEVSESIISVGGVLFEYNPRDYNWVPMSGEYTCCHISALNHYLVNRSPESQKEYRDYFRFIDKLNEILNSKGICSVQS